MGEFGYIMLVVLFVICYSLGGWLVWVSFWSFVSREYPPKNTKILSVRGFSVSGWKAWCVAVFLLVFGVANFVYPFFYYDNFSSLSKDIREANAEYEKTKERIREIERYRKENK